MIKKDRVGETNINKYGSSMKIVKYINNINIFVTFEDSGYTVKTTYQAFKSGRVRSPYDKTVCGKGFVGEGNYKPTMNGEAIEQYKVWYDMMRRCYGENFKTQHGDYSECTVAEEWHNFQNFAKWYDDNYYKVKDERMELDKDILIKRNKLYSPKTCIFVPHKINSLFTKGDRGSSLLGANLHKPSGKFISQCKNGDGELIYLGLFKKEIDAFNAYKEYKEDVIKKVANDYRSYIPDYIYDALISYKVDIDD